MMTVNNTKLDASSGLLQQQASDAAIATSDAKIAAPVRTPATAPAPIVPEPAAALPITHQSHPFWSGFSWPVFLHVLQIAATIAPAVVAVADKNDPAAIQTAGQLSGIAGTLAGALLGPQQ
jgi:hypothetical protein